MSRNGNNTAGASSLPATVHSPRLQVLAQSARTGIVLLDASAPVYANPAAIDLLCAGDAAAERPSLQNVGDALPRRLLDACRDGSDPGEGEMLVPVGREERFVRMKAVPLGEGGGFVLVQVRRTSSTPETDPVPALRPLAKVEKQVHDLRTPMNALGLNAALLRKSLESETDKDESVRAEQIEVVRNLQREVVRLDGMLIAFLRDAMEERA